MARKIYSCPYKRTIQCPVFRRINNIKTRIQMTREIAKIIGYHPQKPWILDNGFDYKGTIALYKYIKGKT